MTSEEIVKIERDSSIATLTFNRPTVLNAFNNEVMEKTIQKVNALNDDDTVHAILVCGEGRAFSPGFDLKAAAERKMNNADDWEKQLKLQFDFIMQFWD